MIILRRFTARNNVGAVIAGAWAAYHDGVSPGLIPIYGNKSALEL